MYYVSIVPNVWFNFNAHTSGVSTPPSKKRKNHVTPKHISLNVLVAQFSINLCSLTGVKKFFEKIAWVLAEYRPCFVKFYKEVIGMKILMEKNYTHTLWRHLKLLDNLNIFIWKMKYHFRNFKHTFTLYRFSKIGFKSWCTSSFKIYSKPFLNWMKKFQFLKLLKIVLNKFSDLFCWNYSKLSWTCSKFSL